MAGTNSAGNNCKSRAEHERTGTFRKDRHSDLKNPEPRLGRPEQPANLDETEQAEWTRMIWRLEESQALSVVDDAALYQYCRLFAETERITTQQAEAQASVEILEQNIRDVKGADLVQLFAQIVTLRKLISRATDQLRQGRMAIRQYLVEFGLTTASRGRIKLPPRQEAIDEFSAYQQQREVQ